MGDTYCWSRGALEDVPNCPACGSPRRGPIVYERHHDASVIPDMWRMVHCGECKSIYLDPRPDAESLPRAYEDYYTHQAESIDIPNNSASGFMWCMINGYLNRRFGMHRKPCNRIGYGMFSLVEPWRLKLDYFGRHLTKKRCPERGRLLDIGCGNGTFMLNARDMGWQVTGCEPDPKAVEACRELGLDVYEGDTFGVKPEGEGFDVATLSHVIEHVQDPVALLGKVYTLLRPGGLVWLGLPNPACLGLHVYGAAWHGLHVPYHLCIPSQRVLKRWLDDAGFVKVRLVRRGAHARNQWNDSRVIAEREKLSKPSLLIHTLTRLMSNLLAAISPRWSEETVVMAQRPLESTVR